jgi:hypothetical protein
MVLRINFIYFVKGDESHGLRRKTSSSGRASTDTARGASRDTIRTTSRTTGRNGSKLVFLLRRELDEQPGSLLQL